MELTYYKAESGVQPLEFEATVDTIYLRKNIVEETREQEGFDPMTMYVYDECAMSLEEFNEYSRMVMAENALKGTNDSANINKLVDGQEMNDMYQLTLMEAIADLYEILLV